jgi:hypothetical protein
LTFGRSEAVAAGGGGAELDAHSFSERVALLEEFTKARLVGQLQRDSEAFALAAGEIEQAFGLLRVVGGRLLNKDVNAGFESLACELEVEIRGRANMHHIDGALVETFSETAERKGPLELARQLIRTRVVRVHDGNDLAPT